MRLIARAPFPRRKPREIESVPSLQPSDESMSSDHDSPSDEEGEIRQHMESPVSPNRNATQRRTVDYSSLSRGFNAVNSKVSKLPEFEPVWKKRLRQSRVDRKALEGRGLSASHGGAARRGTRGAIRDAPSDEIASASSFQAVEPSRSLSNLSGVSSAMSDIFQNVSEQDTFSVDTPQSHRRGKARMRYIDSSVEASDSETASSSSGSGGNTRRREATSSRHWQGCLGTDAGISADDFRLFVELLLKDFRVLCGTDLKGK